MKSRLILALLALNACMAVSLPISAHHQNQKQGSTLQYDGPIPVMKSTSASKHGPHFLEWLAEAQPEHRNEFLQAEERREFHRGRGRGNPNKNWIQQTLKTWSTFYKTQYPTKSVASPHSYNNTVQSCAVIVAADAAAAADENTTNFYCQQSSPSHKHAPNFFKKILHEFQNIDVAEVCSEYGTTLVALCIFLLVPIAVILVEIVDMIHDRFTPEQFPDRGRGRVRLTGPERQLNVWEKCEREKIVRDQAQKSWGNSRRGSKHDL